MTTVCAISIMVLAGLLLAEPPAVEPTPSAIGDDRQLAKEAFDSGLLAVTAGEYQAAVDSFERAYSLRPHPVTLFNLALALEKAQRLPEAWEVFEAVIDLVESDAERREVRRHMREIATQIAILEVHATPLVRLCLDGADMPRDQNRNLRLALAPAVHTLVLDHHEMTVELEPGDQRVLLLEGSEKFVEHRRKPSPLVPAMIGTAIGAGGLASGLAVGAAVTNDSQLRTGLASGAAASAGLAVAASVVALLLHTRSVKEAEEIDDPDLPGCPGSPELEQRIDLRLAPTIRRPAAFTLQRPDLQRPDLQRPGLEGLAAVSTGKLAGIQPRRSESRPHVANQTASEPES